MSGLGPLKILPWPTSGP